jgi:effector-binding domain-containing protein
VIVMGYEVLDLEPTPTAVVRGSVPLPELPEFFRRAYGMVFRELERQGIAPVGEPFAFYPSEPTETVEVAAGVATAAPFEPAGEVVASTLPGGRAVTALHVGPYERLERTYRDLLAALDRAGLVLRPIGMWEEYLTDPDVEPDPAQWRTRLYLPIEN